MVIHRPTSDVAYRRPSSAAPSTATPSFNLVHMSHFTEHEEDRVDPLRDCFKRLIVTTGMVRHKQKVGSIVASNTVKIAGN